MANTIYMRAMGTQQGLITKDCSTYNSIGNKCQVGHEDESFIYSLDHEIFRQQHVSHQPVILTKPIDKATPLLGMAVSNNEILSECFIHAFWTNNTGHQEKFFSIELRKASIIKISHHFPNSLTHNGDSPYEVIQLRYESITWKHHTAGTSGYSIWEDRVY